jgi:hypothetical protein
MKLTAALLSFLLLFGVLHNYKKNQAIGSPQKAKSTPFFHIKKTN